MATSIEIHRQAFITKVGTDIAFYKDWLRVIKARKGLEPKWVVAVEGCFMAYDIDGAGVVTNPTVVAVENATRFSSFDDASKIAAATQNGGGSVGTAMPIEHAITVELEKLRNLDTALRAAQATQAG